MPPAARPDAVAVDVGAGAGLSTAVLYYDKQYRHIAAVDWSRDAWDASVQVQPDTIQFYALDDARFFADRHQQHYDCIVDRKSVV